MEDAALWIVGAIAMLVVVAAFVWVLRHRGDAAAPVHHSYDAPEVTLTGTQRAGLTFGAAAEEDSVDSTVPLSRLGGAGWRDSDEDAVPRTTDPYAGESPTWAEPGSVDGGDDRSDWDGRDRSDRQVSVDDTGPRPLTDELDRERGGHW